MTRFRRTSRRPPVPKPDDRGSVIVAIMISMILVTLGTSVAYAVIGNMSVVLARQNTAQGVSLADAAVSDALFRLDQGTAGTGTDVSYFCAKAGDTNCVADGSPNPIPGAPGASYIATPNNAANPTVWTIKAKGLVHGQLGAVEQTVTRTEAYPFALFAKDQLIVDGNSSSDWATYSEGDDSVNHAGDLGIGTDGQLKCTGGGFPSNVTAFYYKANGSSNTYTCGTPVTKQYMFSTPTAPAGATCPYTDFGSTYFHQYLAAGTYLCTSPITIGGVLDVTGPVQLYVILPAPLSQSTNAININSGSYINDQYDWCKDNNNKGAGCPSDLPVATDFQLFTNSNGTVGNANGSGYDFGGILYAPAAAATEDGCKSNYYGAIILDSFTCNGSPNYTFNYDNALFNDYGPWVTGNYAQIAPSSVVIP